MTFAVTISDFSNGSGAHSVKLTQYFPIKRIKGFFDLQLIRNIKKLLQHSLISYYFQLKSRDIEEHPMNKIGP